MRCFLICSAPNTTFVGDFIMKKICIGLALTTLLVSGCSKNSASPEKETYSAAKAAELASLGETAASADHYARLGEMLLAPASIEYADEMFQVALKLDPNHARANFYSAFTQPILKFKGFTSRMKDFESQMYANQIQALEDDVAKLKVEELNRFLTDAPAGAGSIHDIAELQKFLRTEILPTVAESAVKLKKLATGGVSVPLSVNLSRFGFVTASRYSYAYSYCYNTSRGRVCDSYSYNGESVPSDQFVRESQVKLDRTDLSIFQAGFQSFADYLRLYTAYSMDGGEQALGEIERKQRQREAAGSRLNTKDVVDILKTHPRLFSLESAQQLKDLKASAMETMSNLLNLDAIRSQVCNSMSRMKSEVLFKTVCLEMGFVDTIDYSLNLLSGPQAVSLGYDRNGRNVVIVMDLSALLNSPVGDLKSLLPNQFDTNREPIGYPDETFGGLFPRGDLFDKLSQVRYRSTHRRAIRKLKNAANPLNHAKKVGRIIRRAY